MRARRNRDRQDHPILVWQVWSGVFSQLAAQLIGDDHMWNRARTKRVVLCEVAPTADVRALHAWLLRPETYIAILLLLRTDPTAFRAIRGIFCTLRSIVDKLAARFVTW